MWVPRAVPGTDSGDSGWYKRGWGRARTRGAKPTLQSPPTGLSAHSDEICTHPGGKQPSNAPKAAQHGPWVFRSPTVPWAFRWGEQPTLWARGHPIPGGTKCRYHVGAEDNQEKPGKLNAGKSAPTSSGKERLPPRGPLPTQAPESRERAWGWAHSGLTDTVPGRRAQVTDPLAPRSTVPFFLASVRTDIFTGFAG